MNRRFILILALLLAFTISIYGCGKPSNLASTNIQLFFDDNGQAINFGSNYDNIINAYGEPAETMNGLITMDGQTFSESINYLSDRGLRYCAFSFREKKLERIDIGMDYDDKYLPSGRVFSFNGFKLGSTIDEYNKTFEYLTVAGNEGANGIIYETYVVVNKGKASFIKPTGSKKIDEGTEYEKTITTYSTDDLGPYNDSDSLYRFVIRVNHDNIVDIMSLTHQQPQ